MRSNNREKVSPMVAFLASFLHSQDNPFLDSSAQPSVTNCATADDGGTSLSLSWV